MMVCAIYPPLVGFNASKKRREGRLARCSCGHFAVPLMIPLTHPRRDAPVISAVVVTVTWCSVRMCAVLG